MILGEVPQRTNLDLLTENKLDFVRVFGFHDGEDVVVDGREHLV